MTLFKVYLIVKSYKNFPFQDLPKYTKIGGFGMKIWQPRFQVARPVPEFEMESVLLQKLEIEKFKSQYLPITKKS
jgi:hypothetical protein